MIERIYRILALMHSSYNHYNDDGQPCKICEELDAIDKWLKAKGI